MRSAVDEDVLERAFADNRVLVTNDKDFGDLIYRSGRAHAGVLLLRLQDESPTTRVRVVAAVLANWAEWLSGNVVVATERSVRVRHPR
jgi:predicted nuclease of predicted toxin-antitoxin system